MFARQILHKLLLRNALGNRQTSQEYFTTIVYAKFGGQTECIMDNWKIVNVMYLSAGDFCYSMSVSLIGDFGFFLLIRFAFFGFFHCGACSQVTADAFPHVRFETNRAVR